MLLEELNAIAEKERAARKPICIRCCMSAGCLSSQSDEIKKTLEKSVAEKQLSDRVELRRVGCMGLCGQGPLVRVEPEGVIYERVTPENASTIVDALIGGTTDLGALRSQATLLFPTSTRGNCEERPHRPGTD